MALSYVMTASWGAAQPAAHHLLNIAIHAGNGLLVMGIARTGAGLSRMAAAFAAVVFVLLPVHAESVAWITGRVDSMPTLFYLAAFLAYARWREGRPGAYAWSLTWFFVALFSKQNTITLPAALIAYDLVRLRRMPRPSWSWARPYVPFVVMTCGFLALRYVVVGTVVRENQLNVTELRGFLDVVIHHTQRTVFGHLSAVKPIEWALAGILAAVSVLAFVRLDPAERRSLGSAAIFFGLVWWILGVAPVVVAGYESPRHVYLAAVAWAMVLGLSVQMLASGAGAARKYAAVATAAVIVAAYSVQLFAVVGGWNVSAAISKTAVARLELEALATPPGSLVIVGVPISSWEWAAPFMAQPPYTRTDLTQRVYIVTPWRLHCCRGQWLAHTRRTLEEWNARRPPTPIVALAFDPRTGAVSRLTDAEYPGLRTLVPALREIDSLEALDRSLLRMLDQLVTRQLPR
ncbi:MAG: hypothetical protein H0W08_15315 [Acidobacteria bacterium]|nr:hypothetical protein [Acidobacteriota bacterium]